MILLYLNTFHAAGSFGYTLAEHTTCASATRRRSGA
jgi:hypothetical protein